MTTRIQVDDEPTAQAMAQTLESAGLEVAVVTVGGQDEQPDGFLVATPAGASEVAALLPKGTRISEDGIG
ncbi:hypothetical protein GCM10009785_00620 [Brooklawnia cerclae]|uniref:Uncharacterized protein n=1 Tax=Brooklawnia cerclae TaxID=349934 RepID=A0ABX0SD63_9ACTN|nr:hypothetical protein [Brooklawnia cerclae]NIH56344.1 hypothetical protein [Brooklawnia cerclae]